MAELQQIILSAMILSWFLFFGMKGLAKLQPPKKTSHTLPPITMEVENGLLGD